MMRISETETERGMAPAQQGRKAEQEQENTTEQEKAKRSTRGKEHSKRSQGCRELPYVCAMSNNKK